MVNKIIMVGATTQNNTFVNGQSMMFQLFVNELNKKNIKTIIVDFGKSIDRDFASKRISGAFSTTKAIDNFLLIFKYLIVVTVNWKAPIYITTSQSKYGFLRDYIFISIGKLLGHKIIAHQFGANYNKFYEAQSLGMQFKIRTTLEKTDKIIVEGDYTKNHFKFLKNYNNKVISIPNGLPENVDSETITSKYLPSNLTVNLLYLSNLIEGKGYWDVLEAINILVNRDGRKVNAIFAGKFLEDVEDKKFSSAEQAKTQFFNYIKNNKLSTNITYYEGLYGQNKVKAFTDSNFFLLPSYYINEGQPVSVLEAIAYGCVPIVTKYRLIPDMVNLENGIFVAPNSPVQIANEINEMIRNPEIYHEKSENGISYYLQNFQADQYIAKILALF